MHFTAQYNIIHYTLSNFHCGDPLHYIATPYYDFFCTTISVMMILYITLTKLNSVAFSPQANYTDRATAAF
jgi:hypothetical protein